MNSEIKLPLLLKRFQIPSNFRSIALTYFKLALFLKRTPINISLRCIVNKNFLSLLSIKTSSRFMVNKNFQSKHTRMFKSKWFFFLLQRYIEPQVLSTHTNLGSGESKICSKSPTGSFVRFFTLRLSILTFESFNTSFILQMYNPWCFICCLA
jgi:hypothetical protein